MKIKSFITDVFLFTLLIMGIIIYDIIEFFKKVIFKSKIKLLLKILPNNCYLEINYRENQIKLNPILCNSHNNLIAIENNEKYIKKYNSFYKAFIMNELHDLTYHSFVRVYKEDHKILINYYESHRPQIKLQKIY